MILVTGGNGFLGRSVCARLLRENLAYLSADARAEAPCDIRDPEAAARPFRAHPVDTVIHLAALLPSACQRNPAEAARVNIVGSMNLLESAAAARVRRFVFGSSISVYGLASDAGDIYGAAKRYIEIAGEAMGRARGFSFVALRMAMLVGPGARHTASPWRAEIFEKLGSGAPQRIHIPLGEDEVRSLVHVDDAAGMLVLLATRPEIPMPVYDSPAENWRMGDLKQALEALDRNVSVELADPGVRPAVPLAGGARFTRDFGWQACPLADRLAACLLE